MNARNARPALALAIALPLAACSMFSKEPAPMSQETPLQGIDWQLVSAPGAGEGAAILRLEDGSFNLSGPCNRHRGEWQREGDRLRFGGEKGAIASTKMMCPPPMMAREQALLAALRSAVTVQREGPFLLLVAADGSVWRFDSRAAQADGERELVVHVAGQRVPCTGVAPTLCLQVRLQPGAAWQAHYGEIEGFEWQVGVEYVIRVAELPVADASADAGSRRWVLKEVLQRSR